MATTKKTKKKATRSPKKAVGKKPAKRSHKKAAKKRRQEDLEEEVAAALLGSGREDIDPAPTPSGSDEKGRLARFGRAGLNFSRVPRPYDQTLP